MRLTKRAVEQVPTPDRDTFYWDDTLKGFGVKVTSKGRKSFVVQSRVNDRVRRVTIGVFGSPWSVDQARDEALLILAKMSEGVDPNAQKQARRTGDRLSDFIDQYLRDVASTKKPNTLSLERSLLLRHVVPLVGKKRVVDLTKPDVQRMLIDIAAGKTATDVKTGHRGRAIVKGGKGSANRAIDVLSTVFAHAIDLGLREDNPTVGIKKYKLKRHDRYLSQDELFRLGNALRESEEDGVSPFAIAAIRFMLLSGCRSGEALNLQWDWIDYEHNLAKLPDSKTGQKVLLLGKGAMELLRALDRVHSSPLVFPSAVGGTRPISIQKVWRKVRSKAGLDDLRLHDLRHNFASAAVSSGQSLYIVGKLLGHNQSSTTERYAHLAPDPVRQAADDVSDRLSRSL